MEELMECSQGAGAEYERKFFLLTKERKRAKLERAIRLKK